MKNILKIENIKIENYRSIIDSGDVFLEDRITTLAGKNESGKTTVLNALSTFGNDNFENNDRPNGSDANPSISVEYSCTGIDIKDYFNDINIKEKYMIKIERTMEIKDKITGNLYDLINLQISKDYSELYPKLESETLTSFMDKIQKIIDNDEKLNLEKLILNYLKNQVTYGTSKNILSLQEVMIDMSLMSEKITTDSTKYADYKNLVDSINDAFSIVFDRINSINLLFPSYIYFDSFNDMIPDEIEYRKLEDEEYKKNNKGFLNLLEFLEISTEQFIEICDGDKRDVNRELSKYSKKFTGYFNNIYKQETIKINLRRDGNIIVIELYDDDEKNIDTKPSQRSKGFQWFFAFFLVLENQKDKNTILLIDEPGLYLHASAQEDILKIFEENLENSILYTTHSPYLIDTDKMYRIKLVIKDYNGFIGTKIENKYYSLSDKETMTPIVSAIGYNVSKSPVGFGTGLNIITEGVSDRYYLLAFHRLLECKKTINVVPSIGAAKTHLLASICIGWNIEHLVLLDNDQGGNDAKKPLKKLYYAEIDEHVKRTPIKNGSIESVFSDDDKEYTWYSGCNKDKLAVAKEFYENVMNNTYKITTFNSTTIKNIKKLLTTLNIN